MYTFQTLREIPTTLRKIDNLGGRDVAGRTWDRVETNHENRHQHLLSNTTRQYPLVPDHPGRYCRGSLLSHRLPDHSTSRLKTERERSAF